MKKKKGFNLQDICGEKIIVGEGVENIDFSKIISLNESAAYLWEAIGDGEFDADLLTSKLCGEYEVTPEEAKAGADAIIRQWQETDIIEA